MRNFLLLSTCLLVLSSSTCKKATSSSSGNMVADSIRVNRLGGFAGFNDHYMVYPDRVLKDTMNRDLTDHFDFPEPAKIPAGRDLLRSIPEKMWNENNKEYGIVVMDGITLVVVAYRKGERYYWVIQHDPPAYVEEYAQKIFHFFGQ